MTRIWNFVLLKTKILWKLQLVLFFTKNLNLLHVHLYWLYSFSSRRLLIVFFLLSESLGASSINWRFWWTIMIFVDEIEQIAENSFLIQTAEMKWKTDMTNFNSFTSGIYSILHYDNNLSDQIHDRVDELQLSDHIRMGPNWTCVWKALCGWVCGWDGIKCS